MFTILLFIMIMIRLLFDNEILYRGAYNGLMLWYQRLIPLLLPFILISSILTAKVSSCLLKKSNTSVTKQTKKSALPIYVSLLLGTFCGCPIGAKTISTFCANDQINNKTANLLLPACNSMSPIFLSGYIYAYVLNKQIPFIYMLAAIYIPYLAYMCIFFLYSLKNNILFYEQKPCKLKQDSDYALSSVLQITYIGLYIMICSIIIEFIMHYNPFSETLNYILCGATELSSGTKLLITCTKMSVKQKTALILSLSSFGGICTLFQTKKAIRETRLSLLYYTAIKLLCALFTYKLTILIL